MCTYERAHTGGLVQRNKPSSDGAEASGWDPPKSEKELDLPDQESAGYDEDAEDSKALRLTLMEEVLLLGLKDREVCVCVDVSGFSWNFVLSNLGILSRKPIVYRGTVVCGDT